jgi:glycosyltransferase involved in cell wall biosynthesis
MKKIAIHNPYLDTLGGGERYTLSVARVFADRGFMVDVEWEDKSIEKRLVDRFGISCKGVNFLKDIKRGDGYDICFWVSDGSIPLLRARKNFLHFQVPFRGVDGKSLLNKMKLIRINEVICNSYFTKNHIDKEFGVKSGVVYPPVDTKSIRAKRKENTVLSVGRFSQLKQSKNQAILVKAFKKIYDYGEKNWRLILAGGVEVGVGNYVRKLKKESEGYPIEIIESPDYKVLKKLYGKSKIFWSASGFGIDEDEEPQRVEHFGISVVEAMAAGCVPIAVKAGGHKEIIDETGNGYLWLTVKQLIDKTINLIENRELLKQLSHKANEESAVYEYERFAAEILELV